MYYYNILFHGVQYGYVALKPLTREPISKTG
jgi:hypothetical protein